MSTFTLVILGRNQTDEVETIAEGKDILREYIEAEGLGARDIGGRKGVAYIKDGRTDKVLGWYQYNGTFVSNEQR